MKTLARKQNTNAYAAPTTRLYYDSKHAQETTVFCEISPRSGKCRVVQQIWDVS